MSVEQEKVIIPKPTVDWDLSFLNLSYYRQLVQAEIIEPAPKPFHLSEILSLLSALFKAGQPTTQKSPVAAGEVRYPLWADNFKLLERWLEDDYDPWFRLLKRFHQGLSGNQLPSLEKNYLLATYQEISAYFEQVVKVFQVAKQANLLTASGASIAASAVRSLAEWREIAERYVADIEAINQLASKKITPNLMRKKIAQRAASELLNEFNYQNSFYNDQNHHQYLSEPLHRQETHQEFLRAALQTVPWNKNRRALLTEQYTAWQQSSYPLFKETLESFNLIWSLAQGETKQLSAIEMLDVRDDAIQNLRQRGIKVDPKNAIRYNS